MPTHEDMTPAEARGERDPEDLLPRMTLSEHLDELRGRVFKSVAALVVAMAVSFFFWQEIYAFVRRPYVTAATLQGLSDARLHVLEMGEGFLQVIKLCFLAGVVASAPIVLWQMWGFIAAGLYAHERRAVRIFFPVSVALFGFGMVAAYKILIPFALSFLMSWNQSMDEATLFSVSSYVSMCLGLVFGMGIMFELPLVMLFLEATGIVSRATFHKGWRVAVLAAFIIAMVITPDPSPVTQILMALPMVGLYFLGIWGGRFVGEGREPFTAWKAWPLWLAAASLGTLFWFSDDINRWAATLFR
jgi:sec-independent protein translocase protein TatC